MKKRDPYKHLRDKYHASPQYQKILANARSFKRDRYRLLKEHGICVRCGKAEAQNGSVMCHICLDKHKKEYNPSHNPILYEKRKLEYQERKGRGVCVRCGREYTPNGTFQCDSCLAKKREARAKYSRERNRCHDCGRLSLNYRCKACERKWKLKNL